MTGSATNKSDAPKPAGPWTTTKSNGFPPSPRNGGTPKATSGPCTRSIRSGGLRPRPAGRTFRARSIAAGAFEGPPFIGYRFAAAASWPNR